MALESKEYSIKGWNWGSYEFQGSNLNFIVNNKPAFEIPLGDVSNSMVAGKNEVSLEFGTEDAAKKSSRNDELMEIRFYVPGAAKKESGVDDGEKKIKAEREDGAEGTEDGEEGGDDDVLRDEDGEEISAAQLFSDTVKEKADISALTGEPIMAFDDLLCLTPRYVGYTFSLLAFHSPLERV